MICVQVERSKTNPFRCGIVVFLGRADNALCPVSAMLAYIAVRGGSQDPLFCFQNCQALTRDQNVAQVRATLVEPGVDTKTLCRTQLLKSSSYVSGITWNSRGDN